MDDSTSGNTLKHSQSDSVARLAGGVRRHSTPHSTPLHSSSHTSTRLILHSLVRYVTITTSLSDSSFSHLSFVFTLRTLSPITYRTMSDQPALVFCPNCPGKKTTRNCSNKLCLPCCRRLGGCSVHKTLRRSGRSSSSIAAQADGSLESNDAGDADEKQPPGSANNPLQDDQLGLADDDRHSPTHEPPAWARDMLRLQMSQGDQQRAHTELLVDAVNGLRAAILAQQPAVARSTTSAASALPPLPPEAAATNLPRQTGAASAASDLGPAGQASGAHSQTGSSAHQQSFSTGSSQVNTVAHIHQPFIQATYSGSAESISGFLRTASGSLLPQPPGQAGPTLDQLLARGADKWRPYTSDDEFKRALNIWNDAVVAELAKGGDQSMIAHNIGILSYIRRTLEYIHMYGHKLVYEYHKRVMDAANKKPPLYLPETSGETHWASYMEVLLHARPSYTSTKQRTPDAPRGRKATSAARSNKRPRSSGSCSIHRNADHSNDECFAQQSNKRADTGKSSSS